MPFSSIAYNRGNRVGTAGGVLLCSVVQQVELRQTVPVRLTLPAAQSPDAEFVPTVVACPKVLQDSVICLQGALLFYTRQEWLAPGTAVECGVLTAEAVVSPGPGAVSVVWLLTGVFTLEDSQGRHEVTAQTLPMMRSCEAPAAGLGTWQAAIAAECLACAIVFAPGGAGGTGLRTRAAGRARPAPGPAYGRPYPRA